MLKIGFFGGSFNPPTNAHIYLANEAINEFNLDKLIFVPVSDYYQKEGLENGIHRLNMLNLVCDDNPKLEVSDIEFKIGKHLYAIDIFNILKEKYINDDIYYIMGADNFNKISKWKNSQELLNGFKYIILKRRNETLNNFKKNTYILNNSYIDISSTDIRNKIKQKESIEGLLPKKVENYIYNNKLYYL